MPLGSDQTRLIVLRANSDARQSTVATRISAEPHIRGTSE